MRREIDFVGKRKFFITLSLLLIILSVVMMLTKGFKLGVEFKRLGITNSKYIKALKEAVKKKEKKVTVHYKSKGKEKSKTFATDYLDWRACTFAVRSLQQVKEAQETYRMAIPGDGYKF